MHLERSLNMKADFQFPSSQYYKALTTKNPTNQQHNNKPQHLQGGVFCKKVLAKKKQNTNHTQQNNKVLQTLHHC